MHHFSKHYTKLFERQSPTIKKASVINGLHASWLFLSLQAMLHANRVVEDEQFHVLLKELNERYLVPGRTAIEQEMNKLLIDLKSKMEAVLQSVRKIAITTDVWSKKGFVSSFLGITAHFFSQKDHRRHCMTLAVCQLPSPHTGDRIEQLVC